ncbi:universal stress protein [Prolixibacteraceae bacterium Z1-6]|uniref:Universal stress protein n=1 Tax=Draconibacterium aestuarii TaxID=2998507 RepID=A0A9X3F484_9BACT|nr:universal stress protein [Prolixibacteraceae bacterium Z1-6]
MENQLITLLRITTPNLGSFVKDKLESHGIEVFFTNEGLSKSDTYNPNEVLLKVKAKHTEKAIEIILRIHKDYDLDKIKEDSGFSDLKKILVPVKLSEDCIELCHYAMSLARKTKAEVKLLYVYADPTINEPDRHTTSWEKYVRMELQEAFNKAQLKLVNFSRDLKKHIPKELFDDVKIHYRMLKGTPVNVITEACKRYHPDVILMGTKAKRKEDGEFYGKTMVKVIEATHYPVLAVPVSATFKGKEKINVMYATNFYDADNTSLNKLLEILKAFDKKIHCVHIDLHDDPHHQEKVDELNKMLAEQYSEHNIKCVLFESDNLVNGFDNFITANDIDIISISKVRHSAFYKMFHSDLSIRLVTTRNVPILIFPV